MDRKLYFSPDNMCHWDEEQQAAVSVYT